MKLFIIENRNKLKARITDYGRRVVNLFVPGKTGSLDVIVLGCDNLDGYLNSNEKYYGAAIGRYGNRTGNAQFSIGNKTYKLEKNNGEEGTITTGCWIPREEKNSVWLPE